MEYIQSHVVQDDFINNLCQNKSRAAIYLLGGVRLDGQITDVDDSSLILSTKNTGMLVFKHSISTIIEIR